MFRFFTIAVITFVSANAFAGPAPKAVAKKARGPASVVIAPKHFKDPRTFGGSTSYGLPADLLKAMKASQK